MTEVVEDSEREAVRVTLRDKVGLGPGEVEFVMELSLMQHQSAKRSGHLHTAGEDSHQRHRLFVQSLYTIARADGRLVEEELQEIEAIAAEFGIDRSLLERFPVDV